MHWHGGSEADYYQIVHICVHISLFAPFKLICVHYCIDVVAVVVEIYSIGIVP